MSVIHDVKAKRDLIALVLILSVSAVIAYGYFYRVDLPNFELRLELHSQIIAGTAPSPYNYRILVPFTGEVFTRVFSIVFSRKAAFLLSYAIYDLLSIFFLLATLFVWLRNWFSREQTLVGVLFVAGTMPIALQNHYFQPWSLLEAGLFTAALLAIHRKRYWLLAFLVTLASLNRETAIFIPLVFLLASFDVKSLSKTTNKINWKPILMFGGLVLLWAVVFFGLRYLRGSASQILTIEELFVRNTSKGSLFGTFINGSLFLGGFWIFSVLGFRFAPSFIKRISLVVPLYLITVIIWGVWYEVRLLMSLYPIFVSLGLSFVYQQELKTNTA